MGKFVKPIVAVVAGIATSWSLQAAGIEPLYAKLAGLAVVFAGFVIFWRRSAAP